MRTEECREEEVDEAKDRLVVPTGYRGCTITKSSKTSDAKLLLDLFILLLVLTST